MPDTRLDALYECSSEELQQIAAHSARWDERFLAADILNQRRQTKLEQDMVALTDDELEAAQDDDADVVASRAAESRGAVVREVRRRGPPFTPQRCTRVGRPARRRRPA